MIHFDTEIKLLGIYIRKVSPKLKWSGNGVKVKGTQSGLTLCNPWTIQSMEFSRPEYWSGYPFPSPGDLPNPGLNPGLPHCRWILHHLSHQGRFNSSYTDSMSGPVLGFEDSMITDRFLTSQCLNSTGDKHWSSTQISKRPTCCDQNSEESK